MTQFTGFMAMEYYWLIMNRTFIVFLSADGLYGWKVHGVVSALTPRYFERYVEKLRDPDLMNDSDRIKELASDHGGFFIPRESITSAEFIRKRKWGMGGVAHSGIVNVKLSDGGLREFILLGDVNGLQIEREILSGASR